MSSDGKAFPWHPPGHLPQVLPSSLSPPAVSRRTSSGRTRTSPMVLAATHYAAGRRRTRCMCRRVRSRAVQTNCVPAVAAESVTQSTTTELQRSARAAPGLIPDREGHRNRASSSLTRSGRRPCVPRLVVQPVFTPSIPTRRRLPTSPSSAGARRSYHSRRSSPAFAAKARGRSSSRVRR